MGKKLTHDLVESRFKLNGFILLSQYQNKRTKVLAQCYCGKEFLVSPDAVYQGLTKSCGCYKKLVNHNRCSIDISTEKFGRLTPIRPTEIKQSQKSIYWLCQCDCGNTHIAPVNLLRDNKIKSCGCLYKENLDRLKSLHGKEHFNYKKDLDRSDRRYNEDNIEWRKNVFNRDNYICQICYIKGTSLVAHHLDGYHWCISGRCDINNGITLCKDCHVKFHTQYGNSNNTKEQFIEYSQDNKCRDL